MQPHLTFHVIPKLPQALEPLNELVYNIWWSWEPEARSLFRTINVELWEKVNHSPMRMLQLASQDRLIELSNDDSYLYQLQKTYDRFRNYMTREDTY